ncbi:MAG TPA: CBS domain-containing protein [Nitrososphaeraceae archaeon]|nr:CBS domain-containing protein [Nitrososphaeraceae archaeon]
MATVSIGDLMTEKLKTIESSDTAQEASKKMRDNNISSLVVVDKKDNKKPIGIVTERDLVRKVCVNDASSSQILIKNIMSSPLITIDSRSSVEVAADIMTQNKVRHLLVVEENANITNSDDDDYNITRPLGIITPSDFVGYLKENLDMDDVNAKILESLKEQGGGKGEQAVEELEQQGDLQERSQTGGEKYESEKPRQG